MAGFSTVLYQISAGISEGVQTGDDVIVSVRNLTKSFGPARGGERGGWAWRPGRGSEGHMKKIFYVYLLFYALIGEVEYSCVTRALFSSSHS